MGVVFSWIFMIIVAVTFYSPSVMIARNVMTGIEQRELTTGENILSFVPVFNLTLARKALYGSSVLMTVVYIVTAVLGVITSILSISGVDMLILVAFFLSIALRIMIVVCWFLTGFVVQDIGACLGCGAMVRVISFVLPPVGEFFVAKASPKLEYEEDDDEEDDEDE